jgi:hypothetical protein
VKDLDISGLIIFKYGLKKYDVRMCAGCSWLRLGTSGGLLQALKLTIGFHKIRGIS